MVVRAVACWVLAVVVPVACASAPQKPAGIAASSHPSSSTTTSSAAASSTTTAAAIEPTPIAPPPSASVAAAEASPPPPATMGIAIGPGTRVFLFGDSMVNAGLGQRLSKLVKERGALYDDNNWSSSTVKKWSESERLPNLLFKAKPDVVFVVIGSNEVYYNDPHAGEAVQKIVKKLGGKPCVWIGPPVWKTEKGIVESERDNSAPCAFFDSSKLALERQKDGIHPSLKGGAAWADAVWSATVAPKAP